MIGFVTLAARKTTSVHKSSIREFAVFILEIDEGVLYFSVFSLPVHFMVPGIFKPRAFLVELGNPRHRNQKLYIFMHFFSISINFF